MREIHPFGSFIPPHVEYLLVGTFPGRQYSQRSQEENDADETAFSYGGRNQFWKIMAELYQVELPTRTAKKALFKDLNIGIVDIIHSCERQKDSNADTDLINIEWNKAEIETILKENTIKMIFCTGSEVLKTLKKWFPSARCIALPSPSPRYARLSFEDKVAFYKTVFPLKIITKL